MKYLIIVETMDTGFSAYSPDLPGCIATGADRAEVEREMGQTIEFHLQGLREEGLQPRDLKSYSSYVEIPA
tara:strand:+ start:925 stop:1137 length:213 start_codon:yes stop_codon:yes gene_type:complete